MRDLVDIFGRLDLDAEITTELHEMDLDSDDAFNRSVRRDYEQERMELLWWIVDRVPFNTSNMPRLREEEGEGIVVGKTTVHNPIQLAGIVAENAYYEKRRR